MASVHFIRVKFVKPGKLGQLPCNFQGTKTFYFDSDNEALTFADIAVAKGCTIEASGMHQAWSVRNAEAKLQIFQESVDKI